MLKFQFKILVYITVTILLEKGCYCITIDGENIVLVQSLMNIFNFIPSSSSHTVFVTMPKLNTCSPLKFLFMTCVTHLISISTSVLNYIVYGR